MGALRAWTAVGAVLMLLLVGLVTSSSTANQDSLSAIRMVRSDPGEAVETPIESIDGMVQSRSLASWTIIVYLAGDNNLDTYMEKDLASLTAASSNSDIKVLVLFDKSDLRDTRAYYLTGGSRTDIPLNQIDPAWQSELNMGDPNTLVKFVTYCTDHYPAEHYLVVPQDHGGAWQGCCWDDSSNDRLTLSELGLAFSTISGHIGKKVDVVLFNDCLMSNLEVLFQVQPSVSYAVASESIGWTNNWDDSWTSTISWMKADPGRSGEEVAVYLTNIAQLTNDASYVTQSVAAINMTKVPELVTSLGSLSDRLIAQLAIEGNHLLDARNVCSSFEGPYIGQTDRLIDLYQFAQALQAHSEDSVIDGLCADMMDLIGPLGGSTASLVIEQRSTASTLFSHGISIYFPGVSTEYESDYVNGNALASSTSWNEMVLAIRQYIRPNDTILVDSDADLARLVSLSGWSGRGTSSDPYKIKDQLLVGLGPMSCIYLGNVTKYVLIESCAITGLSLSSDPSQATGISLFNSPHVRIEHNNISSCVTAISLQQSPTVRISNNTVYDASVAVSANLSRSVSVADNILGGSTGVQLNDSDLCRIERNAITAVSGVVLASSSSTTLMSNVFTGGGLEFADIGSAGTASLISNTVNGQEIMLLKNIDLSGNDVTLNAGQIILANVTNGRLVGAVQNGTSTGLLLIGCSQIELTGCVVSSDRTGIMVQECSELKLDRNMISGCLDHGLVVRNSDAVMVWNNTFEGNVGPGISLVDSSGCIVSWNNFLGNNGSGGSFDAIHVQATDVGGSNLWAWSGRGNHWSDLTGPDANGNGIVDVEYQLVDGAVDPFPLMHGVLTDDLHIDSDAELLIAAQTNGWSGTGNIEDPIIVSGLELIVLDQGCHVFLGNVSLNVRLEGLHIASIGPGATGMQLFNSDNVIVSDGTVSGFGTAISLIDTGDIGIANMSLNGGVKVSGGPDTWQNISIDPLTKVNGKTVMLLSNMDLGGATISSPEGQVILVNVTNAILSGQSFNAATSAVQLAYCHQIIVENMTAVGGASAIFAQACSDLQVSGCSFSAGSDYAIKLTGCINALIFNNDLIGNHGSGTFYSSLHCQAYDDGLNDWNGAKRGNHWSDWTAPDANGDRVVDVSYPIAGGASSDSRSLVLSSSIDIEPPEVHILSPAGGTLFTNSTLSISWTVHDNESALSDMSVLVDGVHYRDVLGSSSASIGPLPDGAHQIIIIATDADGNSASDKIVISIDALGPIITFISPSNGSAVGSSSPTVRWSCTDAGTAVEGVNINVNGSGWASTTDGQFAFTGLMSGWHEIWLNATDASGHFTLAQLRFMVDTALPDLRIDQGPEGIIGSANVTIRWSAWDNQSGLVWAGTKVDSGQWTTCYTPGLANIIGLPDGWHNVTVAVRDAAGNTQSKAISFRSDSHGPSLTFQAEVNGTACPSHEVQISWSGSDLGSEVVRYEVCLDSGSWAGVGMDTHHYFTELEEGYHTVQVRAVDAMGWESVISASFWVDLTFPELTFITPWPTMYANNTELMLEWSVNSVGSPVNYYKSLDGAASISIGPGNSTDLILAEGAHEVNITARDLAGNQRSVSVTVVVDLSSPRILQYGPVGDDCALAGQISILLDEPLSECRLLLDGEELQASFDGYVWNASTALLPGTGHRVTVTATDFAGNAVAFGWDFNTTFLVEFRGRMVGADGLPIAGATVTAGNYSCVTDGQGNFILVAPYDVGRAEVTADGMAPVSIDLTQTDLGAITMKGQEQTPSWALGLLVVAAFAVVLVLVLVLRARKR